MMKPMISGYFNIEINEKMDKETKVILENTLEKITNIDLKNKILKFHFRQYINDYEENNKLNITDEYVFDPIKRCLNFFLERDKISISIIRKTSEELKYKQIIKLGNGRVLNLELEDENIQKTDICSFFVIMKFEKLLIL